MRHPTRYTSTRFFQRFVDGQFTTETMPVFDPADSDDPHTLMDLSASPMDVDHFCTTVYDLDSVTAGGKVDTWRIDYRSPDQLGWVFYSASKTPIFLGENDATVSRSGALVSA